MTTKKTNGLPPEATEEIDTILAAGEDIEIGAKLGDTYALRVVPFCAADEIKFLRQISALAESSEATAMNARLMLEMPDLLAAACRRDGKVINKDWLLRHADHWDLLRISQIIVRQGDWARFFAEGRTWVQELGQAAAGGPSS